MVTDGRSIPVAGAISARASQSPEKLQREGEVPKSLVPGNTHNPYLNKEELKEWRKRENGGLVYLSYRW
jgi:hypothetical protein